MTGWSADLPVDAAHPAQVAQQRVLLRDTRRLRVVVRVRVRGRVRVRVRVRGSGRVRVRVSGKRDHREHHDADRAEHLGHADGRLVVHAVGHVPLDGVEPAVPEVAR